MPMQEELPRVVGASRFKAVVLCVAYAILPLGALLLRLLDPAATISIFMPWLLLAGVGSLSAILIRRSGVPIKKRFLFEATVFITVVAILLLHREDIFLYTADLYMVGVEFIPAFMLLFAWLWVETFGQPDRRDFVRFGGLLGLICVADFVVEGALVQTVPMFRYLGDLDTLAALLLVPLCVSLMPGLTPQDTTPKWGRVFILLGIAATLSRTGMFTAAWIVLCFGRGKFAPRIALFCGYFLLITMTALLPPTQADAARYVDYWLWTACLDLIKNNPLILLTGLPMTAPLPITLPPGMAGLWEAATGVPSMLGAFLTQLPSFWLRIILAMGALPPLIALTLFALKLFKRLSATGTALLAVLLIHGMATPLLYDPSVAAMFGLASLLVLRHNAPRPNRRIPSTPQAEPVASDELDPADEWNMRPL